MSAALLDNRIYNRVSFLKSKNDIIYKLLEDTENKFNDKSDIIYKLLGDTENKLNDKSDIIYKLLGDTRTKLNEQLDVIYKLLKENQSNYENLAAAVHDPWSQIVFLNNLEHSISPLQPGQIFKELKINIDLSHPFNILKEYYINKYELIDITSSDEEIQDKILEVNNELYNTHNNDLSQFVITFNKQECDIRLNIGDRSIYFRGEVGKFVLDTQWTIDYYKNDMLYSTILSGIIEDNKLKNTEERFYPIDGIEMPINSDKYIRIGYDCDFHFIKFV